MRTKIREKITEPAASLESEMLLASQGQTAPRGQSFDVNRTALSLYPFVASFKEISLKSDFI